MGFKVIKDNVHTEEDNYTLVGKEYNDYQGGKYKIRLLDDDGEVYLYLHVDEDPEDSYEEVAFAALDYFEGMYGVTELQYKDQTSGEYITL
jgi:hypothetical protein